jgi:hypothetical protein
VYVFFKKISRFVVVALLFLGFLGYQFINAYDQSDWFPPESGSIAPQNNVAVPINTGSSSQVKTGDLGLGNTLALFGDSPRVAFVNTDLDVAKWVVAADTVNSASVSVLRFLYDRDKDKSAENDYPAPLEINADDDVNNDYAKFSNQVWADSYCDKTGDNCIDPATVSGGADFSVLHTYSTTNNDRGVAGASCSCNAGDMLTSCGGNGTPMISVDPNACSSATMCTCFSTKATPKLCTVTITATMTGGVPGSVKTVQAYQGTKITLGALVDVNFNPLPSVVNFTGGPMINNSQSGAGQTSITQLGFWNGPDWTSYGAGYIDRFETRALTGPNVWLYGPHRTFMVNPGVSVTPLPIHNGWNVTVTSHNIFGWNLGTSHPIVPHDGAITASVGVCQ